MKVGKVLAALAVLVAAGGAAPGEAAAVRLRLARAAAPGFNQAGDNALLPTEGEETASEKKPFKLEDDAKLKDIEDALNNRDKLAEAEAAAKSAPPSDEEARRRVAAEKAAHRFDRPGLGKPCGTWDCSGKGLCFDGVCRCHEDWHGDDCSTKYQEGEKRERREEPLVPEKDAQGGDTAGKAAEKQGLLNEDTEEATTPTERNALDLATTGKPSPAPVDKQEKARAAAEATGKAEVEKKAAADKKQKGQPAPKPEPKKEAEPAAAAKAAPAPAPAPAPAKTAEEETESLNKALDEEKKIEEANEKAAAF